MMNTKWDKQRNRQKEQGGNCTINGIKKGTAYNITQAQDSTKK